MPIPHYIKELLEYSSYTVKVLGELMQASLGPRGSCKCLIDRYGKVINHSNGGWFLRYLNAEGYVVNPIAKILVEAVKDLERSVGDGTKSLIVLVGELVNNSQKLASSYGIHPMTTVRGYEIALEMALNVIDKLKIRVNPFNKKVLQKVAETALGSYAFSDIERRHIAHMLSEIAPKLIEIRNGKIDLDYKKLKIVKIEGGGILDSEIIDGIVMEKRYESPSAAPKRMKDARIALIYSSLKLRELNPEGITYGQPTADEGKLQSMLVARDPETLLRLMNERRRLVRNIAEKLKFLGANLLICRKEIEETIDKELAARGIMSIRRARIWNVEHIAEATGAKMVASIDDLKPSDLGYAEDVEIKKIGSKHYVFIRGCRNPKSFTLLLRGSSMNLEIVEQCVKNAMRAIASIFNEPFVLPGGGAIEMEVAKEIRKKAVSFKGKEQLAILKFAEALEAIPKGLAENSGMNALDTVLNLRAMHERGLREIGINAESRRIVNAIKEGIIDPSLIKEQILKSAVGASNIILRLSGIFPGFRLYKGETGEDYVEKVVSKELEERAYKYMEWQIRLAKDLFKKYQKQRP